ncbi:MAG: ATPase, T2SS/T4P/T4SS family, partial [Campylobacterales bacterium]|nr:ATPase, T2SS/T4P/T4SS family [Campylobacterales bacterium]
MVNTKIRLGDLLIHEELATEKEIEEAFNSEEIKSKKKRLGEYLIDKGIVEEEELLINLSIQLGIDYLTPGSFEIDFTISKNLQISSLRSSSAIPISQNETDCLVLFSDPLDLAAQDVVQRMVPNKNLKIAITTKREIANALEKLEVYEQQKGIIEDIRKEISKESTTLIDSENSAILRLINLIIETAIIKKSSDIHIEPSAEKCHIRIRVDGYLTDIYTFDSDIFPPLASKIKLLANLDIAERRKPQDGRFSKIINGNEYDFRLSTLPITHGESIVFRILDKQNALIKLDEIGFQEENVAKFREAMSQPYGIVFVTGPTGSGKTTTLYAGLNEIKNISKKIITVEDPVEYQMDLIQQVQVNEKADLNFANALRSILRQDPDIIMVGE